MTLSLILSILKIRTDILNTLLSKATPDQASTIIQRYLDDTEWIHALAKKLSNKIEARVNKEEA